ncbi:uncharacterized protein LOC123387288 [Mustela putorius furo]|uniref:Uncharacterized protein LOC123387288 n=1 Tax=Mustela putorius furo TaxID=9669 RepID=A0A8U0R8B4_MUSPF|nr:uncharacterized protein LOC123387288 [Mustela putorius furo]
MGQLRSVGRPGKRGAGQWVTFLRAAGRTVPRRREQSAGRCTRCGARGSPDWGGPSCPPRGGPEAGSGAVGLHEDPRGQQTGGWGPCGAIFICKEPHEPLWPAHDRPSTVSTEGHAATEMPPCSSRREKSRVWLFPSSAAPAAPAEHGCVLAALSPAGGAFLFRPRVHGRPGFQLRPLHTGPGVVGKRQLPSLGSALGGGVCSLLRGGSEPAQQGKGAPEENRASPTPSPPWGPPPDQDFALESRVRSCGQSTRTDSIVCADVSGCVWGDAVHPRPAPCPRGTSFQGCPRTRRLGPSAGANQGNRTCLFQRAAASAP